MATTPEEEEEGKEMGDTQTNEALRRIKIALNSALV